MSLFNPLQVEVIGLGQASVDYLGRVASLPPEDEKVELASMEQQCGGPASTALVTLSRLGVKTSFLGAISDDPMGLEILKGLKEEKVDTSCLKIRPGYTSQFAFIAITRGSGKRTIFWHRGSAPPLRADEVDLSPFQNARILHLDGLMMDASLRAARQAWDRGLKVVLDAGTFREGSLELLPLVHVLIASERFAAPLVGPAAPPEQALKVLSRFGPEMVIITLGPKGSMGWRDGTPTFQKAVPVRAADTTGAGDVYHGAYIYGMLQGRSMGESMRFASIVAAMKCRETGARKGIPTLDEVLLFEKALPGL